VGFAAESLEMGRLMRCCDPLHDGGAVVKGATDMGGAWSLVVSAAAAVTTAASMSATAATAVEATATLGVSTAAAVEVAATLGMSSAVVTAAALSVTSAAVAAAIASAIAAAATVAAAARVVAGASVEATATLTAEAMVAPAVAVAPVGPGTDAEEDAVVEVARAVVAVRSATVGGIAVIAVLADGLRAVIATPEVDANADLGVGRWWGHQGHECQGREQRSCTQEGLKSAHFGTFQTVSAVPIGAWVSAGSRERSIKETRASCNVRWRTE
jgi:hypothetical protein